MGTTNPTRLHITTETGSLYELNFTEMTWARLSKSEASGHTRTENGTFTRIDRLRKGHSLQIFMPPLPTSVSGTVERCIITSFVADVKNPDDKPQAVNPLHVFWQAETHDSRPEHQTAPDGYWYFWTETWADLEGPYPDFATASRKISEYGNWLTSGDETFYTSSNGE